MSEMMEGTLFKYGPGPAHVAFKSGGPSPAGASHVVAVGGLTDGLLFSKYLHPLNQALHSQGISLVQPLLTSSHQGWGLGSVSRDAEELALLAKTLKSDHGSAGFVLLGHSTGCQDAVMYTAKQMNDPAAAPLLGVVLQAPVSDREWLATQANAPERIEAAKKLVEAGKPQDVAFRADDIDGAALSAQRWLSLAAPGGEDDMFSSDYTDDELKLKLQGLQGVPTLLLLSGAEEYVPPHVDYRALGTRMAAAIWPSARVEVVEGGNHSLSEHGDEAAQRISAFVSECIKSVFQD